MRKLTLPERIVRFWASCTKTTLGCWLWNLRTDDGGYGRVKFCGRHRGAHQVSWELTKGHIPKGLGVLHTCDVRSCINPDHLFLGTVQDNMRDKVAKNRQARGQSITAARGSVAGINNGRAKLSERAVFEIRQAVGALSVRALARMYGVSPQTIWKIGHGQLWKDNK